jgi:uncharacterized protein (TIGR01777 family)
MKVVVTGSTGLIGTALVPFLSTGGHEVVRLSRLSENPSKDEDTIHWEPKERFLDIKELDGVDAVVHLAGENLGNRRWSPGKKKRIRDSRVYGTRFLSESLALAPHPPKVLVSASAIGYYGDRGNEDLDEDSGPGSGFLSKVCLDWEAATEPARQAGIRVVNLRIGPVLSGAGGVLDDLVPIFRAGAGGTVGSGKQYVSWISIDDLLGVIQFVLGNDRIKGPVNAVAPNPVTNAELTRALGRVLRRPTAMKIPALAARVRYGEAADELILASARVTPTQLLAADFTFHFPTLEETLRHVLGAKK